jgi:cytoskeletal protein RodZ
MFKNNHLHKARKISKEQSKEDIKKLSLGHQNKAMKVFFMVIVIHVVNMVTNLLNVDLMKEYIMEDFITP